jgi:hypothetical protein
MKAYGGSRGKVPQTLTSSVDGLFTSRQRIPLPVELEAGWDTELVWTLAAVQNQTTDYPARNAVAVLTTLSRLLLYLTGPK